jgi:predicted KAP-like P-loop ATPase
MSKITNEKYLQKAMDYESYRKLIDELLQLPKKRRVNWLLSIYEKGSC